MANVRFVLLGQFALLVMTQCLRLLLRDGVGNVRPVRPVQGIHNHSVRDGISFSQILHTPTFPSETTHLNNLLCREFAVAVPFPLVICAVPFPVDSVVLLVRSSFQVVGITAVPIPTLVSHDFWKVWRYPQTVGVLVRVDILACGWVTEHAISRRCLCLRPYSAFAVIRQETLKLLGVHL